MNFVNKFVHYWHSTFRERGLLYAPIRVLDFDGHNNGVLLLLLGWGHEVINMNQKDYFLIGILRLINSWSIRFVNNSSLNLTSKMLNKLISKVFFSKANHVKIWRTSALPSPVALREKCPNTEYFSVFRPNAGKYWPEKTPYLNTFHVVLALFSVSCLPWQLFVGVFEIFVISHCYYASVIPKLKAEIYRIEVKCKEFLWSIEYVCNLDSLLSLEFSVHPF